MGATSPGYLTADGWERVSTGESGAIVLRSVDGARYAKFVTADRRVDLEAERDRVQWARSRQIPTAQVLDWTADDEWACLTTTAVPGVSADRLSPSQLWEAWPSITASVRLLHEVPVEDCPFDRRLEHMFALADQVVSCGAVNPQFLPVEYRPLPPVELLAQLRNEAPRRIGEEQADLVVCHGDLCLPNVIVDPATLAVTGVIDLGRLGRADRFADIALLLGNSRGTWGDGEQAAAADSRFAAGYGLTLDRSRQQFYLCLDALTWPAGQDEG